jgi:hypothetical protein
VKEGKEKNYPTEEKKEECRGQGEKKKTSSLSSLSFQQSLLTLGLQQTPLIS